MWSEFSRRPLCRIFDRGLAGRSRRGKVAAIALQIICSIPCFATAMVWKGPEYVRVLNIGGPDLIRDYELSQAGRLIQALRSQRLDTIHFEVKPEFIDKYFRHNAVLTDFNQLDPLRLAKLFPNVRLLKATRVPFFSERRPERLIGVDADHFVAVARALRVNRVIVYSPPTTVGLLVRALRANHFEIGFRTLMESKLREQLMVESGGSGKRFKRLLKRHMHKSILIARSLGEEAPITASGPSQGPDYGLYFTQKGFLTIAEALNQ